MTQDEKVDVRIIQGELLGGPLYREVVETERALAHKSEYDIGSLEDRRFAILCHALQESASGAQGTSINLHGCYRELAQLRRRAGKL